jgi:hypothetical protein
MLPLKMMMFLLLSIKLMKFYKKNIDYDNAP